MMHNFFKKNQTSTEELYEFKPIKNDSTDGATHSLFEQLEEGDNQYTDIVGTINSGANLYAKKVDGDYRGCYPIHIAAYNVDYNMGAVKSILKTFNNSDERKKYIYLQNEEGKNAFEILVEFEEEDIALPSIRSLLSYLSPDEQQALMNSVAQKRGFAQIKNLTQAEKNTKTIVDLGELWELFHKGKYIDMCAQRKREAGEQLAAQYDFKNEKLGTLSSVYNKKFTARVSYTTGANNKLIPELVLIPSDWRLQTAVENNNQGDHVIAYVLLLSSLSHCQGADIKKLPSLICNLACSVLPDHKDIFLAKKQRIKSTLKEQREIRIEAISALQTECEKKKEFIDAIRNNLIKVEIESIARHTEDAVDELIKTINKLEGESFSQARKAGLTGEFILQKMAFIINYEVDLLQNEKYAPFRKILVACIKKKAFTVPSKTNITEKTLKALCSDILEHDLTQIKIPESILGNLNKLTQTSLLAFLKENTPLKKYHEGQAIQDIKSQIDELKKISAKKPLSKLAVLNRIGCLCAKLFDYPRVGDPRLDDVNVLYQAIPRHFIIINAAFIQLKNLDSIEKQIIYESFLRRILVLQLWREHRVNEKGTTLNLEILKENILEFAHLDESHDFTMKSYTECQHNLNVKINMH